MKTKEELRTTRKLVEELLENDVVCRNSDKWLIYRVLERICKENGGKLFVPFNLFEMFPAQETITRERRRIQNHEGKFIPTDPNVIAQRGIKEKRFRKEFRYR